MNRMERLLWPALLLVGCFAARAEKVEGVIVKMGDSQQEFALTEIKEITFADDGMTLVKTDAVEATFPADWEMTFGMVEMSGLIDLRNAAIERTAMIYTVDGKMVRTIDHFTTLRPGDLPAGVYIVECNGKSLKVKL